MRPKQITIDPDAVDADGISVAATLSEAGNLTLGGALTVGGVYTADIARRIGILSAGNDSGDTFTITGTDPDGKAQVEEVTGASGGTAESTGYFATVTIVYIDGASASNVSVGTVDEFSTNTIPIETSNHNGATVSIEDVTGTFDVSVEQTFSNVQDGDIVFQGGPAALTNAVGKSNAVMTSHATGLRLIASSYTTGADLKFVINQNR